MRFTKYLLAIASVVCALSFAVSCDRFNYGKEEEHTHTFGEWQETTPAKCTVAGEKTRKCSGCEFVEKATIDALGHDEVSHEAKTPTCSVVGNEAYVTCTRCTYTTYKEIAKLSHKEVNHEAKEPTCTMAGNKAYVTCENCDYTTYEEIPAQHKFDGGVCTECGEEACESHSFGDWYGNTATCQNGGEEYRTCSVCTFTEKRATEKLSSHKYENKVCIWCGKRDYTLPPQPLGLDEEE